MSTNTVSPRNETNNEGGGDEKEIDEGGGGEGEDEKEMDDGEGEVKSQVQNVSTDYCNPQLPEDITEDVGDKLRGDAIGDTLYSERFVLLVLMKLIKNIEKVEWSEEFETEMCSLWDMTIEKDVVLFLLKHDFIKLATCLLQLPDLEPRFLEIIVGILHNMCCVEEVRKELCEMPETTSCLMDTLSSNDSLTLVQAVRLLNTVAWDVVHQVEERDPSPHWLARAVDDLQLSSRLAYILLSSTRPELLCCTLDLMNTLCVHAPSFSDKDFSRYFANEDIAFGLLAAWRQLFRGGSGGGLEAAHADVPAKALRKAADQWAAILSAFSGHEIGKSVLCLNAEKITSILNTMLHLSEDNEDMLRDTVAVLEAIIPNGSDIPTILPKLLRILYELDRKPKNDEAMSEDSENLTLREALENYFESLIIHVGNKSTMETHMTQCDENLKHLFWTIIERRDPELLQEQVEAIVADEEPNQHSI